MPGMKILFVCWANVNHPGYEYWEIDDPEDFGISAAEHAKNEIKQKLKAFIQKEK